MYENQKENGEGTEIIDLLDPISNEIADLKTVSAIIMEYELSRRHEKYLITCAERHIEALDTHFRHAWDVFLGCTSPE